MTVCIHTQFIAPDKLIYWHKNRTKKCLLAVSAGTLEPPKTRVRMCARDTAANGPVSSPLMYTAQKRTYVRCSLLTKLAHLRLGVCFYTALFEKCQTGILYQASGRREWPMLSHFTLNTLRNVGGTVQKHNTRHSVKGKVKGKGHPCTGTEALYRPYGP